MCKNVLPYGNAGLGPVAVDLFNRYRGRARVVSVRDAAAGERTALNGLCLVARSTPRQGRAGD